MIFLITYELKNKERNYESLYNEIKKLGHWWHYIKNTWIVRTNIDLNECTRNLHNRIDDNDRLLIIDITNIEMNGWLPEEAWRWIVTQRQLL